MSALTVALIAEAARQRLGWSVGEIPRLEFLVPEALKALARRIADSGPDARQLLVRDINATPVAGVIDLSAVGFTAVLIDTYQREGAINTQAETALSFFHVPTLTALKATTPADANLVWYHLRGRQLIFKNPATGALNTFATNVKLAGSYVPTLAEMPDVLDDELIVEVMDAARGKTGPEAPALLQVKGN